MSIYVSINTYIHLYIHAYDERTMDLAQYRFLDDSLFLFNISVMLLKQIYHIVPGLEI